MIYSGSPGTVITAIGFDSWKRNFNKKDIICQLVIDCQKLVDTGLLPKNDDLIYDTETPFVISLALSLFK
jgi:hypothetical protein